MKRTDLIERLELLRPAVADSDIVPAFTNYCFLKGGAVRAYNDQIGIEAKLPREIADKSFGVHAATLLGLLKSSKAGEVEFTFEKDQALVKAGKSKMKLPYMPEEEFLFVDDEVKPAKEQTSLDLKDALLEGIASCMKTVARDNTMPAIMGVNITGKEKTYLYSCDGDAITRYKLGKNKDAEFSFTMPNEFCESLLRITAKTKCKTGSLFISDEWAVASLTNGYKIYGRVIEKSSAGIDHASLMKKTLKSDPSYMPTPKGLNDALSRARVVADSSSAGTKATLKAGKLVLATESHVGAVRDVLKVPSTHPDVEATINAAAMQRSLGMGSEVAIMDNCTAYREGKTLLSILSNMGE